MTIVDRIRALANAQNMNLPELETRIGLGNGTISRWRTSAPNTDKLTKIADYFNVSTDYLLGRDEVGDIYLSLAKEAERNGIEPGDIMLALETIKKLRGGN
jgi:transcriptional regulator with XRE-family HTH domain